MAKTAKRRLSNIDFSKSGAHLALCSKDQGAANEHNHALIMKSSANFSEEFIEKAKSIRVTLEIPEFIQRFFGIYGTDVDVLASLLGYDESSEKESEDEMDSPEDAYEKYVQERIKSFEIMKSVYLDTSVASAISKLTEDQYLSMLEDQVILEKAFEQIDKKQETPSKEEVKTEQEAFVVKAKDFVKYTKGSDEVVAQVLKSKSDGSVLIKLFKQLENKNWEPTGVLMNVDKVNLSPVKISLTELNKSKKESNMEPEVGVELIEKSQFDAVTLALEEQRVALEKANLKLADLEKKEKELIRKSKFDAVSSVVKDKEVAEKLFKAFELVEDQAIFDEVLETVKGLMAATKDSEMFIEKGASTESSGESESPLVKRLKAKYKK